MPNRTEDSMSDQRINRSTRTAERATAQTTRPRVSAGPAPAQMSIARRAMLWALGAAYLLCWVAGLAVFGASIQVRSSGEQVLSAYAGHAAAVTTQFVLTEGVAGLIFAAVLWQLALVTGGSLGQVIRLTGLTAAAISISQCVIGVLVATRFVSRHDAVAAGAGFELLTRLDGVKMLLLAVAAMTTAIAIHRARLPLPRLLGIVAVATAAAIAISGVGYLTLDATLALAAYASLPLLVGFISGSAICLGWSRSLAGHRPAGPRQ
jgi:hypothetical protein